MVDSVAGAWVTVGADAFRDPTFGPSTLIRWGTAELGVMGTHLMRKRGALTKNK